MVLGLLAGPAIAQANAETVVRVTGFLGDLRFSAADVRADLMGTDPATRQIAIAMNEDATAAFTLFTTTHVNQSVTLFICGQQIQPVTVQAPIDSGFVLSDAIPLDIATAMVAALNGEGDCP